MNGKAVSSDLKDGYFSINRKWKKGDKVEIHFDMEPRTVKADEKVEADRGRVSVERGPIVYCAEWADNDFDIANVFMNREPRFEVVNKPDLLHGINQIKTQAQTLGYDGNGKIATSDVELTLIPYYAWAHRGAGAMSVWLPNELRASRAAMPPTLASTSKVDASHMVRSISAINDRLIPKNEHDRSMPHYNWWPKKGVTEWVTYTFPKVETVNSSTLYWFDDSPWGDCRVPKGWKLYYKTSAGNWELVANPSEYGVKKGAANEVSFDAVATTALKLEVVLPDDNSSGIMEWVVK